MDRSLIGALKTLTDVTRLQVVGALSSGDASVDELAERTGIARAAVDHHLGRLRKAGLVDAVGRWPRARYHLKTERLNELGRSLDEFERSQAEPVPDLVAPEGRDLEADEARVLDGFFAADRLTTIPAQQSKRLVVLRYLRDRCFAEDRDYPEKEVNQRLALFHPDPASLRRYMVDAGLMTREAGTYRRAA
jgi:DNA-binding transcriptional ArsR family regulator